MKARLPQYQDALAAAAAEQQAAAASSGQATDGIAGMGAAAADASAQLKAFDDALRALFDQTFSVEQATDAWHSSLNDLTDAVKENGRSTKGNTDEAIANREALRQSAQKAYDLVQAYADTGASAEEVTKKSKDLKAEFIKQATEAGFSKKAAEHYAEALDQIPGTYTAVFKQKGGDDVIATAKQVADAIAHIPGRKTIDIVTRKIGAMVRSGEAFAQGGLVTRQMDDFLLAAGGPLPVPIGTRPHAIYPTTDGAPL